MSPYCDPCESGFCEPSQQTFVHNKEAEMRVFIQFFLNKLSVRCSDRGTILAGNDLGDGTDWPPKFLA